MPNKTHGTVQDEMGAELERLAKLDCDMSPAIAQIIRGVLAAKAYDDPVLMHSQLNAVFEASQELVDKLIEMYLGRPQFARERWQNLRETLTGIPAESFDEVRRSLEALFVGLLQVPVGLRDGPMRMLEEAGYEVKNAAQLRRDIQELEKLREDIFEDWPWAGQSLPPVNRKMVAESRAAIARKEGEGIEDLIRRLGGTPAKFD